MNNINLREIKTLQICEGKSKQQSLFYYLRISNNYSLKDISFKSNIKLNAIKKIEGNNTKSKRCSNNIVKKLLKIYNINFNEYLYIIKALDTIKVYSDEMVEIYSKLFNLNKPKSMLLVHTKLFGYSNLEYKHLIRVTRANIPYKNPIIRINQLINKEVLI